jgi:hypothetical protein
LRHKEIYKSAIVIIFIQTKIYIKASNNYGNQSLKPAQDPATRRIWYGIATAHDLEAHDGMTEENLYQKIFASHFGHLAVIFYGQESISCRLQGNFETWVTNPLK